MADIADGGQAGELNHVAQKWKPVLRNIIGTTRAHRIMVPRRHRF
jgi:hypothetical protein